MPAATCSTLAYDDREGGTVFAAINSPIWGPEVQRSDDLGATWQKSRVNPAFPKDRGESVEQVWHIEPGRPSEPGVFYAGVSPSALFRSDDGGETWGEVVHLSEHPTRPMWQPGFGGLCLHSMVLDPANDAGCGWGCRRGGYLGPRTAAQAGSTMNAGVRADFAPDPFPEFGQCTHKMLAHPSRPGRLYQQNHCGFFRSDDGGRRWLDLSDGLPSRFGMVMGTHSGDPDTVYVVPEDKALGTDVVAESATSPTRDSGSTGAAMRGATGSR